MYHSNPTSGTIFPAELVDSVIDYNHDDPETLMTCALVNRQWTPSSRFHLFSRVTISHTNAREFIQLLASPHCTFLTVLCALDVHFVPGSQRWFNEFSQRLFLVNRTTITSLGISGSRNTPIRDEARLALSMFTNQVNNLFFGPVIFPKFADFAALICGFHALESLSCVASFQDAEPPHDLSFTSLIRYLKLSAPSVKLVLEFLLQDNTLPTVTSLSLSHLTVEDYPAFSRYMQTPNSILQSLVMKMDINFSGVPLDVFVERLDMTQLTALRELCIDANPCIPPQSLFNILSGMSSSSRLEMLKVSACLVQGIARVDILLSGGRFPLLRHLTILGATWDDVNQFLPRCGAKNILRLA